jgi:biopolymer transport protein ExbB/biopolymer transport protein TolQ
MILLSFVSIAVMIERFVFFRRHRGDVDALAAELVTLLRAGEVRAAKALLERSPTLEATVLRPALDWLDGGAEAVSQVLESELGKLRRDTERGTTFLGTIGNNAPFVGLLGTVIGVIQAFAMLGDGGQNKGAMGNVMSGIAEALVATGVGLFVALPAVVGYNALQKRAGEVEANVGIAAKLLLAHLASSQKLAGEMRAVGAPLAAPASDDRRSSGPAFAAVEA